MFVEEIVTYMEMNSRDELIPGRVPPQDVHLERHDVSSLELLRSTYGRVGAPHGWIGRMQWSEEEFRRWLLRPGLQSWIGRVNGEVAGMVEIEIQDAGNTEIVVFGLVPEFVNRGFGGHFLTLCTQLAWDANGDNTRRLWLHTSSRDHENAKSNYLARGFKPFKVEQRQREVPDDIA